jgi:hypothetical protein
MIVNLELAYVLHWCETQSRAELHVFSKSHVPSFNYLRYMQAYMRVDSSVGTVGNVGLDLGLKWQDVYILFNPSSPVVGPSQPSIQ